MWTPNQDSQDRKEKDGRNWSGSKEREKGEDKEMPEIQRDKKS